jgi:hypothetical protein
MVTMVEDVPSASHGVALGSRITVNRLVQFAAPLLLGLVAQASGYRAMFAVAAIVVAMTAFGIVARRRSFRTIGGI